MTPEDKAYIDKKFAEMQDKMFNPDDQDIIDRAKRYQNFVFKRYWKMYAIGGVIILLSLAYSFHIMGMW